MLKGFKEFIMRGNVIDLAVGVVIGAAFGAVIKAFTDALLNPLLAVLPGAKTEGLGFYLNEDKPGTFVNLSLMINSIITFLLTAALIYFLVVMPMNKLAERRKARLGIKDPEDETPEDIALLREIRDSLKGGGTAHMPAGGQIPPAPMNDPRI